MYYRRRAFYGRIPRIDEFTRLRTALLRGYWCTVQDDYLTGAAAAAADNDIDAHVTADAAERSSKRA